MITLAVVNARVQTGNPRQPWASGIAVEGDSIVAVASSAEIAKLMVESTLVIDAKGRFVAPSLSSGSGCRIERGGVANFFVVDRDVTPLDPVGTDVLKAIVTIAAGQIVYDEREK